MRNLYITALFSRPLRNAACQYSGVLKEGRRTTVAFSNSEPLLFAANAMEAMIKNTQIRTV